MVLESALLLAREIKNKDGEGSILILLGSIYSALEQPEKAKDFLEQALVITKEIKTQEGEAATLLVLGTVYSRLDQIERAKNCLEQALEVTKESKNRSLESACLLLLGQFYSAFNQDEKAKFYFKESLRKAKEINDRGNECASLLGLAMYSNDFEKSKKYYEEALSIAKEINDRINECSALLSLENIYGDSNQYEKAKFYLEQGLLIAREVGDQSNESAALNSLGIIYLRTDNFEKAKSYFEKALQIAKKIKDNTNESDAYWYLSLLWGKSNKSEIAILYGKQVVRLYQEKRGKIKNLDNLLQRNFLLDKEPRYRYLSDILISKGRLAEAQVVLNLIKEQEYEQLSRSGETADTIPYSKSEAEAVAKIDQLANLGREQTDLRKLQKEQGEQFPADKLKRLEQIAADLKTANIAFNNALAALSKADASVKDTIADIQSEKNLQSALLNLGKELNTGAVALYTLIGTEEEKDAGGKPLTDKTRSKFGWVILVTKNTRKAYPIDVTNLEQTVFQFKTALSSDKYDPKPLAQKLYNAIFRQTSAKQKVTLEQDLNDILGKYPDKTLMWSLDGVLRYIPMAALNDGNSYLVEKYRNVLFTKESLLWLMNQPKAKPETLGLGVSAGNKTLGMSALPGVDKELSDIIKQGDEKTGILNGERKLNTQFKKQDLLNLEDEENKFQVVHIASHYSFNPTDQNSSYLLIGDGKLTFGEMKTENNLFGTVDLLTLSACDTGVSGNGKEAEGFAYLAQSLGAKSVIASLWQVSDAGTPELMIRFYKLRAEHPEMSKGEAFREAQLSLLGAETKDAKTSMAKRSETIDLSGQKIELPVFEKDAKHPFAHPHYWSSFVLIGNWR